MQIARHMGGVRSLADLKDRCRIDDETGCWLWTLAVCVARGGVVPMAHIPAGVFAPVPKGGTMPAPRLAWLMSGQKLQPGQVVWRQVCTGGRCIRPDHCRTGTRTEMHAAVAATGRNRGKPERAAINTLARQRMVKSVDVVRKAEAMFSDGRLQKDVRAVLGLSQRTASSIRQGRHPHSVGRQRVVRGASVFNLADSR